MHLVTRVVTWFGIILCFWSPVFEMDVVIQYYCYNITISIRNWIFQSSCGCMFTLVVAGSLHNHASYWRLTTTGGLNNLTTITCRLWYFICAITKAWNKRIRVIAEVILLLLQMLHIQSQTTQHTFSPTSTNVDHEPFVQLYLQRIDRITLWL